MAKKEALYYLKLVSGGDISDDYTSPIFTTKSLDNVGFIVSTSGVTDNTGTFTIEKRYKSHKTNDEYSPWVTMTFSNDLTLANTNVSDEFYIGQTNPAQFRIVFTAAGGTPDGTVDIYVSGCSVGG